MKKKLSGDWDEKCTKYFKKDRPKLNSESLNISKINDETKTGLAIIAWLLKCAIALKKSANENLNISKINCMFINIG